ncbi:hypothetical protein EES41_36395 [Streptomyces sp. ADI95-16]|nr:hypothetical protein EES41_36395 [Streptomyces sp. ADI95-16]
MTGAFGFVALQRKAHREHCAGHEVLVVFDAEDGSASRSRLMPSTGRTGLKRTTARSKPWRRCTTTARPTAACAVAAGALAAATNVWTVPLAGAFVLTVPVLVL